MGEETTFDDDFFETRLEGLKDTQDGIQQMSTWCLQQRVHHKKIVACWLNVFKRVRVEHRLVLFYLANDVIQYSKRKRYEFVESWATALQRATTMVRDEKVKDKILRIFKIWEQRDIYSEEYLSDLGGLLNINPPKKAQPPPLPPESSDDFHNTTLIANIRECVELSNGTDKSFKKLPKAPICDIEILKNQVKDKKHSEIVVKEIERYITYIEAFNKNIHMEIKSRKRVIASMDKAMKFYANQRLEGKVVACAYKNFGNRIKLVKRKLSEVAPILPSPILSPDVNAPSPTRDADLQLPDEQSPISINLFKNNMNGYASYLDGNLPFDINDFNRDDNTAKPSSHPIEVIGSRSDDESYGTGVDYYKPERLRIYGGGNNTTAPPMSAGGNPLPVPAVQSGYTSLARAAQQYSGMLPPAGSPMFGGNNHGAQANLNNAYPSGGIYPGGSNSNYHGQSGAGSDSYNVGGAAPLMPPPPLPSSTPIGSGDVNGSGSAAAKHNNSGDFNASWNMNMSWSVLDAETPHSPPHFERKPHNASGARPIEYAESGGSMVVVSAQDVDHRQVQLPPAFAATAKIGLSKDKTRQLDIDHRNLISLTGSPAGDVDYRTALENLPLPPIAMKPPSLPSSSTKKTLTPLKPGAAKGGKDEEGGLTGYDPADMVIDMDMSDDDLDEIFREVREQEAEQRAAIAAAVAKKAAGVDESVDNSQTTELRPALLDTPGEYLPQSGMWDGAPAGSFDMAGQQQQQQQAQPWNQMAPWNGATGSRGGSLAGAPPPPPPGSPFPPMQFQYAGEYGGAGNDGGGSGGNGSAAASAEYPAGSPGGFGGRGGRGGRGNWMKNSSPGSSPMRHFARTRGGPNASGGNPFYGRGRGGPTMRGGSGFRGKFRGGNAWI